MCRRALNRFRPEATIMETYRVSACVHVTILYIDFRIIIRLVNNYNTHNNLLDL